VTLLLGGCCTTSPATDDVPAAEFASLSRAHAQWLFGLWLVGDLLAVPARPRVHRLIVVGRQRAAVPADSILLQLNGKWEQPKEVAAAMRLVRSGATTPLTSYDINRDGPFGDADPSIYL
jgi:hypothetical protein